MPTRVLDIVVLDSSQAGGSAMAGAKLSFGLVSALPLRRSPVGGSAMAGADRATGCLDAGDNDASNAVLAPIGAA